MQTHHLRTTLLRDRTEFMVRWLVPLLPKGPLTFLDLGSGLQAAKEWTPGRWTYVPIDLYNHSELKATKANLADPEVELPPGDIAFIAGVLESLKLRKALVARLCRDYPYVVLSWMSVKGDPPCDPEGLPMTVFREGKLYETKMYLIAS